MMRQVIFFLAIAAVASAKNYGQSFQSKKNVEQQQQHHQFASVTSYHSNKQAAPQFQQQAAAPSPYSFEYAADGSARQESADASGKVTGSYKVVNEDGSVRLVKYIADEQGFRADVDTNEAGTKSSNPANVEFKSAFVEPAAPAQPAAKKWAAPQVASYSGQYEQAKPYSPAPIHQQPIQATKFASAHVSQQPIQEYAQPSPYAFSYDARLEDGSSSRTESADASGKVVGSYSLATADGRKRTLHYQADHEGFRAAVDTNEFGTKSDSPADVQFNSNAPKEAPAATYSAGHFSQQRVPAAFPVEQKQWSSGSQTKSTYDSSYKGQSAIQYGGVESYAPYSFNYVAALEDGSSSRSESGDGSGKVSGSYSLSAIDGRQRTVDYMADQAGFRATVNTNEFGTKSDSPADIQFYSTAPEEAPHAPSAPAFKATKGHFNSGASTSNYKAPTSQFHSGASATQYKTYSSSGHSFAGQQRVEAQPSYQPSPYSFGYEAGATGGGSARSESADASGKVTGSYTVRNEDGSQRLVEYVADKDGFRANVKTNEPGTKSDDPAHVIFKSDAPAVVAPIQQQQQQYSGKANFPVPTYSQKSSMISQKAVDGWSR